jgi:hypothetical protein
VTQNLAIALNKFASDAKRNVGRLDEAVRQLILNCSNLVEDVFVSVFYYSSKNKKLRNS